MPADTERPPADLSVGERVGEYIVRSEIASGGFGTVYSVTHVGTGAPAALKVLHAELTSTPNAALRFQREVDVIRRIRHPNVIAIEDAGRLPDGRPYFVMELLSGVSLDAFVHVRRRLAPSEALSILEPLCRALAVAHENGVIHRDLKASNVFLCDERTGRRVILLDFGVAKLLDASAPGLTAPSNIVGTPSCMAPEQIRSEVPSPSTDIYALGVLSFFMLTGELPFHDPSFLLMQSMHLYVTPPRPSSIAPIGVAFDDVVLRAMSKDAARRHRTASEFLSAFQAAAARERAPSVSDGGRRALALYVEIRVSPDALDEPDDALFTDIEAVLPLAARSLRERGFAIAVRTGNTLLAGVGLPAGAAEEREGRRDAVSAALALRRELLRRPTLDSRVHVNVSLHVGATLLDGGAGGVVDGELLDLSTWVPESSVDELVVSIDVLSGLGLPSLPLGESCRMVRVADGQDDGVHAMEIARDRP